MKMQNISTNPRTCYVYLYLTCMLLIHTQLIWCPTLSMLLHLRHTHSLTLPQYHVPLWAPSPCFGMEYKDKSFERAFVSKGARRTKVQRVPGIQAQGTGAGSLFYRTSIFFICGTYFSAQKVINACCLTARVKCSESKTKSVLNKK